MIVDLYLVYSFIKRLVTPFNKWPAFDAGIIDADGKFVGNKDSYDRSKYSLFDRLICNIKRTLQKLPGGASKIASYAVALYLLKEHKEVFSADLQESEIDYSAIEEEVINAVGTGAIAGVGIGPDGEPPRPVKEPIMARRKKLPVNYFSEDTEVQQRRDPKRIKHAILISGKEKDEEE